MHTCFHDALETFLFLTDRSPQVEFETIAECSIDKEIVIPVVYRVFTYFCNTNNAFPLNGLFMLSQHNLMYTPLNVAINFTSSNISPVLFSFP